MFLLSANDLCSQLRAVELALLFCLALVFDALAHGFIHRAFCKYLRFWKCLTESEW